MNLRIVPLDEFTDAVGAHVGDVNVSNAAAGGGLDFPAVAIDPVEINQIAFVSDRAIGNRSRSFHRRLAVDGKRNRIDFITQQAIRIIVALQFFAVYSQHVIADVDVHANLPQRRTINIFLVFAFKDLRDAIAARRLIKLKPCAWQAHARAWRNLKVATFDVSMLHAQL